MSKTFFTLLIAVAFTAPAFSQTVESIRKDYNDAKAYVKEMLGPDSPAMNRLQMTTEKMYCGSGQHKDAVNIYYRVDEERDEKGRLKRPYICLWDDNFLASDIKVWKPLLQELIDTGRPFQFRQGLDERMLAQSPYGEEMAQMLAKSKYHGDFIFAFDNWRDRDLIERALKIWKRNNPKKGTKFYLFCGFKQNADNKARFYRDIWELFQRIRVLMQYGCVGYVMRHEDYHKAPIANLYVQIARWCNQQQFYKKMSFWEFSYRNQSYWEENTLSMTGRPELVSFEQFEADIKSGYYDKIKMCLPLRDIVDVLEMFPEHRNDLLEMFNYKMMNLLNPSLWDNHNQ